MELPSQEDLKKYMKADFLKLSKKGYKPEEIASIVLLNYEYVSDRDDFLKFFIYNEVKLYSNKNNLKFPKLDLEIDILKRKLDSLNSNDDFLSKYAVTSY